MSQEEKMDELIREIAVKNGVAVGRRDPIMIVHTMNNKLLEEGKTAQKEALCTLKSELEEIAHRWGDDAKNKAEKILNASLTASKEAMKNSMQEGARSAGDDFARITKESTDSVQRLANSVKKAAYVNLAASVFVVTAIIIALILK